MQSTHKADSGQEEMRVQQEIWYFAYGSNMDMARLYDARLKPHGVPIRERILGRLSGWQLVFNKTWHRFSGGGAANIVPDATGVTFGTLNLMPLKGLDVLDHYEGVAGGHYERRTLRVFVGDKGDTVDAIAYVGVKDLDAHLIPPRFYLNHLLAGRDLLPPDYARWLESHPVLLIDCEA
jgi:cation transport regulator ChaC